MEPKFDRSLLTFNPKNHGHYYEGKRLLGVTTALGIISKGDALVQWSANQAIEYCRSKLVGEITQEYLDQVFQEAKKHWRTVKQEAADIGTYAHNWIEQFLKGFNPSEFEHEDTEIQRKVRNSCGAAVKWIETHHWKTISIERQIFIPKLGVGGICDWHAYIDGVPAVPDWKTSKSIYSSYRYQTAAYAHGIEEEVGEKVRERWVLRIDKETGEFEDLRLPRAEFAADYKAFKNAVQLYRREQELRKGSW